MHRSHSAILVVLCCHVLLRRGDDGCKKGLIVIDWSHSVLPVLYCGRFLCKLPPPAANQKLHATSVLDLATKSKSSTNRGKAESHLPNDKYFS